jgi:hypothetical protein
VVLVVVFGAVGAGCSYNKFVTQEEALKAQWGQVENQLQRRNDLIPNLVETTKGFAQQRKMYSSRSPTREPRWPAPAHRPKQSPPPTKRRRRWRGYWWSSRTIRN